MGSYRFSIEFATGHPAFDGHFPGHPILPGVVLLAEVLAGIERGLGQSLGAVRIKVAKFHAPVRPGSVLTVELATAGGGRSDPAASDPAGFELAGAGAIAFTVSCGDTRVATGAITINEDEHDMSIARPAFAGRPR